MRAATFPGFPSGCLSCTTGGLGASSYGSSYSSSSFGSTGGLHRPGVIRPISEPQGNSYKHEVRSESKIVNGQPVYDLYHERRFEDGHLVHEDRKEKGAKDIDISHNIGQVHGYPDGPGYSRRVHETHVQSSVAGSSDYDSAGALSSRGSISPDYNSGVASLSERLRQQMLLLNNRKGHENSEGSHHSVYSQTRYVNGQPVYAKKEERKYEDGQLVYNKTDVKGADDLGTSQHIGRQYDASGSLIEPNGGYYERREEQRHHSSTSQGQALYPGLVPGHAPGQAGSSYNRHEWRDSSSPSYRPGYNAGSTASSTQYTQESREESSSYRPSYRPSTSSSSTHYSQESGDEASASYRPSYRPSGSSSIQYTQESREETSSGYRPYRPTSATTSTLHTQETREESSSGYTPYRPSPSSSYRPGGSSTQYTHDSREESLPSRRPQTDRGTLTQQTNEESYSSYRPANRPSSSVTHYTQDSREDISTSSRPQYAQETTEESTYPKQPSYRPSGSSSHEREESYESSWQQQRRGYTDTPSSDDFHTTLVQQNTRQPDTTAQSSLDSSRREGSSEIYSQTYEQSNSAPSSGHGQFNRGYDYDYGQRQESVSSHYSQSSSAERRLATDEDDDTVGIPGVLSGPHTQYGNDEKHNKERYDISPLEDNGLELPSVDNEFDSSYGPTLAPADGEIDSGDYPPERRHETPIHSDRRYHTSRQDTSRTDTHSQARPSHDYSGSSYHYQRNRTATQGVVNSAHASTPNQVPDTDSSYGYPGVDGTSRYHYNESWRHSSSVDGQSQPAYGSASSSSSSSQVANCGKVSCIVVGDGQVASSRQTQTRVSTRYVNGELVGITHHIRQYENGKLVHENRTEQSVDELSEEDLRKYGIDQLHLVQGSYEPESYSQRHEVRQEKKYVNGEQIYDLHHEKRFEDGSLVYDNRTEKGENDLGASSLSLGGYDGSYSQGHQEGGARHEVTQSQHLQQHVTSGAVGGVTAGRTSETHQVMSLCISQFLLIIRR